MDASIHFLRYNVQVHHITSLPKLLGKARPPKYGLDPELNKELYVCGTRARYVW